MKKLVCGIIAFLDTCKRLNTCMFTYSRSVQRQLDNFSCWSYSRSYPEIHNIRRKIDFPQCICIPNGSSTLHGTGTGTGTRK